MKLIGPGRLSRACLPLASLPALLLLALGASCAPSGPKTPANMRTETAKGLSYAVPQDWAATEPTTTLRAAQYALPGSTDEDPAEVVVSHFGVGQGGDAEMNIERWIGMVAGPDGKPPTAQAKRESRKVGVFQVSLVTVDGAYDAFSGMGMGGGMGGHGGSTAKPGYRLWGAVVEGPGGPWFFKATGPQALLEKAEASFRAVISSLRPETAGA